MAVNEAKKKYFDSRVADRYIKKGVVSQKEYDSYVKSLPDDESNATFVQMDLHETEISSEESGDSEEDN